MAMQRNAKSQEFPFRRGDVTLLLIPCQVILFGGRLRQESLRYPENVQYPRDILGATKSPRRCNIPFVVSSCAASRNWRQGLKPL